MKHATTLLLCFFAFAITATAQTKVNASDIIKQINEGRDVSYSNAVIEGNLDLTNLTNRVEKRHSGSHTNAMRHDNQFFVSTVTVALTFTNCTFSGDVIAFYSTCCGDQTYAANFEKDVIFKNCTFNQASEFKYSEFAQAASFSGSMFNDVANFKYAEFANGPAFDNVNFDSGADFKYTEFPKETSFEKATFNDMADFKYSKFTSPLNMTGTTFQGHGEFKYTRLDGGSFKPYRN
ncbi:hypothetical protein WSM22_44900 [Cytophagales bacterium WSM2-2]|nr:hypothetical protein WSM22_44900 [Cytophagales bacterium WSM2-2]